MIRVDSANFPGRVGIGALERLDSEPDREFDGGSLGLGLGLVLGNHVVVEAEPTEVGPLGEPGNGQRRQERLLERPEPGDGQDHRPLTQVVVAPRLFRGPTLDQAGRSTRPLGPINAWEDRDGDIADPEDPEGEEVKADQAEDRQGDQAQGERQGDQPGSDGSHRGLPSGPPATVPLLATPRRMGETAIGDSSS